MSARTYLPSTQFGAIAAAIAISGGLVLAAQYVVRPVQTPHVASAATPDINPDWQATLAAIQAQSGATLPQAPDASTTQALLAAAQSSNVTDTVARSLLINLSNEKAQGLGDDAPTQDALVAQALSQLPPAPPASYTAQDLTTEDSSSANLHAYGNAVMVAFGAHTGATSQATYETIATATDSQNPADLAPLAGIQAQYQGLADDLSKISVPQTLAPLDLQALNDIASAAQTFDGMQTLISDPLRAVQSLQQYQDDLNAADLVFTSIAQELNTDGIIFNKDEPGSAWSGFLSTQ